MIELEFMKGNEPHMPFPPYVTTARLTHRFTVLQENTFYERVPDTTFDEAVWRTLIAFIAGYDPSGHVSIAEDEKDLGRKERPLSIYMTKWETLDDERDPPQVVTLRTASALRLCMVTEPYYLSGGPWPYADACVHSLFSDRDISAEVMAFLHDHADTSRWRFADKVLRAEDVPAPMPAWREGLKSAVIWALIVAGWAIYFAFREFHLFGLR